MLGGGPYNQYVAAAIALALSSTENALAILPQDLDAVTPRRRTMWRAHLPDPAVRLLPVLWLRSGLQYLYASTGQGALQTNLRDGISRVSHAHSSSSAFRIHLDDRAAKGFGRSAAVRTGTRYSACAIRMNLPVNQRGSGNLLPKRLKRVASLAFRWGPDRRRSVPCLKRNCQ